jgi:O-antigen ligase
VDRARIPTVLAPASAVVRTARTVAARSDSYVLSRTLVGLLLLVTVDVTNFLDRGSTSGGSAGRYIVLLIPFATIFLIRLRHPSPLIRQPALADWILMSLMLFGLLGSLYGRLYLHTGSTALPIFLPMAMGFVYLATLHELSEDEAWELLRAIALVCLVYATLAVLAASGAVPLLQANRNYRNATSMFAALGFASILLTQRRSRLVAFLLLLALAFLFYPSATLMLVVVTTFVTFFITRPRGSNTRAYLVGIFLVSVLVAGLLNFNSSIQLADDYFLAVGKTNNTNTRLALWAVGIEKFERSPFVGDAFSGETTAEVARRITGGGAHLDAPYHNDYVLFLASGGLLGLGLLIGWFVVTEVTILQRYRGFLAAGQEKRARFLRALLAGYNAWFIAATFNPLFSGASRTMTLFSFYGLMMCAGRPPRPSPQINPPAQLALASHEQPAATRRRSRTV